MSAEVGEGFSAAQRNDAYPPGIERHYWNRGRARILADLLGGLGEIGPVLEIGAGPGVNVQFLLERGVECHGCDLAAYEPVDEATAAHLHPGQDAFDLPEEFRHSIDVVMLLDVLEHLDEPAAFLERCREQFPRLRTILVTLPARRECWSNYDTYYGHIRRYDRRSFAELAGDAHFSLAEQGYFFHALYPPMALMSLLGIERPVSFDGAFGESSTLRRLHDSLSQLFRWEARLLPRGLPGTSLYGILRNPR